MSEEKSETATETQSSLPESVPTSHGSSAFGERVDWIMLAALVSVLPLVGIHCADLWFRTDLRFFPILLIVSVVLAFRRGQFGTCTSKMRAYFGLAGMVGGSLIAVFAATAFSGWLATVAVITISIGWMLWRLGDSPVYELLGCMLPVFVFAILPVSDASDLAKPMEISVASSASSLLDTLSVPHLTENAFIESASGRLPTSKALRGLGSPYLLLAAVVLLCLYLRPAPSVGFLSVLTVPFWSWFGAVLHVVIGIYLWEQYDRNLFGGRRDLVMQVSVLVLLVGLVWLLQKGLNVLLSPFPNYSTTTNDVHKLYNKLVTWPAPDPASRKRRVAAEDKVDESSAIASFVTNRNVVVGYMIAGVVAVGAGCLATYRTFSGDASRLMPLTLKQEVVSNAITQGALPDDLAGMRQVAFDLFSNEDQYFSDRIVANWMYLQGLQRVRVTAGILGRGFYPVELEYRSPIRELAGPRKRYSMEVDGVGTILMDEFELLDDLFGRSYVCYATLTLNGTTPFRTSATEVSPSRQEYVGSAATQPTVVRVQLFAESAGTLIDEQREGYRNILSRACQELIGPLRTATGMK